MKEVVSRLRKKGWSQLIINLCLGSLDCGHAGSAGIIIIISMRVRPCKLQPSLTELGC